MVAVKDIRRAFERLGIVGERVVIHSSLRSFGSVEGGADALLAEILQSFDTVMMPAFSFESNAPPPAGDRLANNGTDYRYYENWSRPLVPFIVEQANVDAKMGVLSRRFAALREVRRSDHPWHSWAAAGSQALELTERHDWAIPNLPLERLAARPSYVLLLGVGLASCTALHIAEDRAGRRPFVRWAVHRDGQIRRMSVAGCAKGFGALTPYCERLLARDQIGPCPVTIARLPELVAHVAAVLRSRPELTRCSDECLRCADAIAGGPRA